MKKISEIKTTKCLAAIGVAVLSAGMLAGCGQSGDVTGEDGLSTIHEEIADPSVDTTVEPTDDTAFGLADYEGLYCTSVTESFDDFELTYTYGYLLNGDGTGVSYGQDIVDITWNETEIHMGDIVEGFSMEPGKLTINDVTYEKIDGNFIAPQPYYVDIDNVDNGYYNVTIDGSGISEADGKVTVRAEIFAEDTYDIVDVNFMAAGDVLYVNGQLMPVETVDKLDSGVIEVNGGIENNGCALRPEEESNCYVYFGMDDAMSYSRKGVAELTLSENAKLFDNSDPTEVKESEGRDVAPALQKLAENYALYCNSTRILVEDGEIVEINKFYTP